MPANAKTLTAANANILHTLATSNPKDAAKALKNSGSQHQSLPLPTNQQVTHVTKIDNPTTPLIYNVAANLDNAASAEYHLLHNDVPVFVSKTFTPTNGKIALNAAHDGVPANVLQIIAHPLANQKLAIHDLAIVAVVDKGR